jgi:hypothetical protein
MVEVVGPEAKAAPKVKPSMAVAMVVKITPTRIGPA